MSAYTTLYITRKKALEIFYKETTNVPTDEKLESFMDNYLKSRLHDCIITADNGPNDDDCI